MSKAWPVAGVDPEGTLGENARRILAVRIGEFYSYGPIVADDGAVEELHAHRIAAKRLRYTLELFRAVFGEVGERQIENVREIQELLGQLHDHDVRVALIEEELTVLAAEQTAALGRTLATAPASTHQAITAAALRPPPDDPRRGLLELLGRQYTSRRQTYEAFYARWLALRDAGMRAELVALSTQPIEDNAHAGATDHEAGSK